MFKKDKLRTILHNNESLYIFFINRFSQKKYRGMHIFQQERLSVENYQLVLKNIKKTIIKFKRMEIPKGDEGVSEKKYNIQDYKAYEYFVQICKNTLGGSPDSYKKITFVNLHRMGLIDRIQYLKNGKIKKLAFEKLSPSEIKISERGNEFLKLNNIIDMRKHIGSMVASMVGFQYINGLIFYLLNVNEIQFITRAEFILFVTYFKEVIKNKYVTKEYVKKLIIEFKKMSKIKQEAIFSFFKNNSKGHLSKKNNYFWDFGNLSNQTDTIFNITDDFGLWKILNDKIYLNHNDDTSVFKRFRNNSVIKDYKKKYGVIIPKGWELHHVVQLGMAYNQQSLKSIDDHRNLVCISGTLHNHFPKKNNTYTKIKIENNAIHFIDPTGKKISGIIGKNVIVPNKDELLNYNKRLQLI